MLTVTVRFPPKVTVPEPRSKSLVPRKLTLAFHTCSLLLLNARAAPLVLSSVPPLIVNTEAGAPSAVAFSMLKNPFESVMPPEKVFAPESTRFPLPNCNTLPAPEITDPKSVPCANVSVRLNANTAPLDTLNEPTALRLPAVPPAPSCKVPAPTVVPPL